MKDSILTDSVHWFSAAGIIVVHFFGWLFDHATIANTAAVLVFGFNIAYGTWKWRKRAKWEARREARWAKWQVDEGDKGQ